MPERVANIIVLAEDREQQQLVRRYALRCGQLNGRIRLVELPGGHGSGEQYVRERFPHEVQACRGSLGRKTSCLLIVITDADKLTVEDRESLLRKRLQTLETPELRADEPVIILIPKKHVETWILCLVGEAVTEYQDCDEPGVTPGQIKQASEALYDWTRPNAKPGPACVPSLKAALPRWRRIPS